jgi:hypothetical protein
MTTINEKEAAIWLPVWGYHHLHLMEHFALRSFMWPDNLPACRYERLHVFICGLEREWTAAAEAVERATDGLLVSLYPAFDPAPRDPIYGLRAAMRFCIERSIRCWVCMPDIIHGNGSLSHMLKATDGKPVTVAAAHARVTEERFFADYPYWDRWTNNRDLVQAAFALDGLHWADSSRDNSSSLGGVSWTKINPTTRLLVHHLPAPWLCYFTESDLRWWDDFMIGHFDHVWPSVLIPQNRFRVIGCSDVAFAIELQSAWRSQELKPVPGTIHQEGYQHKRPNHDVCNALAIAIHE